MTRRSIHKPLRAALGAVALLLAVGVVAPQVGSAQTVVPTGSTVTTAASTGDGLIPPGDWTSDQRAEMLDLIDRTERDLPAFSDPAYLRSIGFHDFGVDAPGGYVHYINPDWMDDGHVLDPKYPESVLFQRTYDPVSGTSTMKLVAAMFFAKTGTTMDTIPADIAWIPGWHIHPNICATADARFAGLANADGTCSSGQPQHLPMTHVWIVDNGCGHRFAMVGIGGLMCDVHMHDHESEEPTTTTSPPTTVAPPTTTGSVPTTTPDQPAPTTAWHPTAPSRTSGPAPSAAKPVAASPAYTG